MHVCSSFCCELCEHLLILLFQGHPNGMGLDDFGMGKCFSFFVFGSFHSSRLVKTCMCIHAYKK